MNDHRDKWVSYCSHVSDDGEQCDCAPDLAEMFEERQAVIDCINLYGDEVLHKALDAIGFPGVGLAREVRR